MTELIKQLVNDLEIIMEKMERYVLLKIRFEKCTSFDETYTNNEHIATFSSRADGFKGFEQNIKKDLLEWYYGYSNLNELNKYEDERKDFETISKYIPWALEGTIRLFKNSNEIHIETYNCNGWGMTDTLNIKSNCDLIIDSLEHHYVDDIDRMRFTLKGCEEFIIEYQLLKV